MRPDLDLLLGRGVHLGELTARLAAAYGDRPAVDDPGATPGLHDGGVRTFAEVEEHVARLAGAHAALDHAGRVLLLLGNRIDVVLHALALARVGIIAVPVNPRLKEHELAAVVAATGATAAVVDDPAAVALPGDVAVLTTVDLGAWALAHPEERREGRAGDPSEVVMLLTTSGTTGVPKAAALTSRGLLGALGLLQALPVGRRAGPRGGRDAVLAALPLTHVMGLAVVFGAWCAGVRLLRDEHFDAAAFLARIEQERPNVVVGVPTMYADLEDAGAARRDLSSVQVWVSGADVMPLDRARRFQRWGAAARIGGRGVGSAAFVDAYGMVELSGAAAVRLLPPSLVGALPAPAIAKVLPGFAVRAVDADGAPVGRGTVGELQFRGAGVLQGYEGRPESGPDADGWLSTGDHGRVFPGGLFQFAGRARDRLKVAGFSVFPAEVEVELRAAPDVLDVALVGVPDERLGERPVAVVVPAPGFVPGAFLAWAHEHVAGYRRPREVVTTPALPRGNHGKIDRAAATAIAVDALT